MKKRNKIVITLFCFLISIQSLLAQTISPFNKIAISDTSRIYSFIVSGHFHGASTNNSTYPASTLLANIDTLNGLKSSFLISLGDMFVDVNDTYIDHYQKSLFKKLKMPLFNAVGNHDLANNNFYEAIYGKTFFSFTDQSELFIVLNTELNDGSIEGEQLTFLKNALKVAYSEKIKNVFIFSHRPVWCENNEVYKGLFEGNTRTILGNNNFEDEVKPLLKEFPKNKNIFWMSGSMAGGTASFFYNHEKETNITFLQTAIRDLPRDAVLQVNVVNGAVSFKGISLTGESLQPIEYYDLKYWNQNNSTEEKFNYRLIPYLTIMMVTHHYFWIGFISSLLLLLILRFFYKKWERNK